MADLRVGRRVEFNGSSTRFKTQFCALFNRLSQWTLPWLGKWSRWDVCGLVGYGCQLLQWQGYITSHIWSIIVSCQNYFLMMTDLRIFQRYKFGGMSQLCHIFSFPSIIVICPCESLRKDLSHRRVLGWLGNESPMSPSRSVHHGFGYLTRCPRACYHPTYAPTSPGGLPPWGRGTRSCQGCWGCTKQLAFGWVTYDSRVHLTPDQPMLSTLPPRCSLSCVTPLVLLQHCFRLYFIPHYSPWLCMLLQSQTSRRTELI